MHGFADRAETRGDQRTVFFALEAYLRLTTESLLRDKTSQRNSTL